MLTSDDSIPSMMHRGFYIKALFQPLSEVSSIFPELLRLIRFGEILYRNSLAFHPNAPGEKTHWLFQEFALNE